MVANSLSRDLLAEPVCSCGGAAARLVARVAELFLGLAIAPIDRVRASAQRHSGQPLTAAGLGLVHLLSTVPVFSSSSSFSNL